MNYIAFDLGASSGKTFIGNLNGNVINIKEVHRFENKAVDLGLGLYWDIIHIYDNLIKGIKKASNLANIYSIGLDTFSNDFGLISKSLRLLNQIYCYRDKKNIVFYDKMNEIMSSKKRHLLTGSQISTVSTLTHLSSMNFIDEGFLLDNTYKLLFISDLLIFFLSDRLVSEYTISSVSEMYDFYNNNWNDTIIGSYKFPKNIFADIVYPTSTVGKIKKDITNNISINEFNIVSVCEHDTASAFLSAPCSDNYAIISSGTWSLIGTEVDKPIINELTYKYNISNEGGYKNYHRIMKNIMGLWILQETQKYYASIGENYTFDEFGEKCLSEKPFEYLIDPDDIIFLTPNDMPIKIQNKCLEIFGSVPLSPFAIARCIFESLALKYRWALSTLEIVTSKKFDTIHIVGGGSQDKILCQFTSYATGKKVLAGPAEATAYGNIIVQMIASKQLNDIEHARTIMKKSSEIKEYIPNVKEVNLWDKAYYKYKNIYNLT